MTSEELDWASEVHDRLRAEGLRARLPEPRDTLSRRIAAAHEAAVPFVVVVGDRERVARALTLRSRAGQESFGLEAGVEALVKRARSPFDETAAD